MNTKNVLFGKRVKSLLGSILLFLFLIPLHAQVGIVPVMKVSNLKSYTENPIRLDILKIDIKVVGQIAVTTLDMSFFNDNARVMEGSFEFPLAEGQTVSRFALDINGSLREGVIVDKEKGRKTFETIVRRGVDPGLLEKTVGNNYRIRVYPLPANGSRRVVLAYEQELTDKGTYDLYTLPLKISEPVRKFSIHAEVYKNDAQIEIGSNELSNLQFDKWNEAYIANFEQNNYVPDKQVAFSFPHRQPSLSTTQPDETEVNVITTPIHSNSDSSYFYVTIRPNVQKQSQKALPKRLTLLWDNSGSAKDRNITKELEVLDAYIQRIGNVSIELMPFNIKRMPTKTFEISSGNWDALKSALTSMRSDGATSLGMIDVTQIKSDVVLLFSDGLSTFGPSDVILGNIPIYTINSSIVANPNYLTYVAQKTGGVYLNLLKNTAKEAVEKLTQDNFQFISAKIENGALSSLFPSMPSPFEKTFSLVGIIKGKTGVLKLNFGFGKDITYSKTVNLESKNQMDSSVLRRIWASKKIEELSFKNEKNKEEIQRTAKAYGIVTDNTSLIVLETLWDYLQNDIVPPIEMQKDYFAQKADAFKEKRVREKNHIEEVVEMSDQQSKWWNTDYPLVPKKIGPLKTTVRFTAPVITDERVQETTMKNENILSSTHATISVADVQGTDELKSMEVLSLDKAERNRNESRADIQLNAWDPQTPYYKVLQYAAPAEAYNTYLKLKLEYGLMPSFYMDAADFFNKAGYPDTALVILSNLAELDLESSQLLRALGNKLMDYKRYDLAVMIYLKIKEIRGEDPQTYRDLGLALHANKNDQSAIETLYEVVKQDLEFRFDGIELIVMNEINNIIATHPTLDYSFIDKRLLKKEPVDIRVCLTWDTDDCDMDLWVTDPTGVKCFFDHQLTRLGGKISRDITQGFGPEEFMLKKAVAGKYIVQTNYYGTRSQAVLAPVNLHLRFITNYGKPGQTQKEVCLRLENAKDVIDIGTFTFKTNETSK